MSKKKIAIFGAIGLIVIIIIYLMASPVMTSIQTKDGRTISVKTVTFPDGREYVGEFNKEGDASGYGILYKADGSISYEGDFIDGQPAIFSTTTAPSPAANPIPASTPANKPTMTMAEFAQLKDGMNYEDATKIIGEPGEVVSESGTKGDALHTIMYQYNGEGDLGANANLMFQGNKLINKAQFGLK